MQERFGVAVAGTHGKSTTTAMIAYALLQCGADPSFVVGGTVPQLGGGSRSRRGRRLRRRGVRVRPQLPQPPPQGRGDHQHRGRPPRLLQRHRRHRRVVPPVRPARPAGRPDHRQRPGRAASARRSAGSPTPVECVALDREATWSTARRPASRTAATAATSSTTATASRRSALRPRRAQPVQRHHGRRRLRTPAGVEPGQAADAIGTFTGVDRRMTEVGAVQRRDRRRRLRPPPDRNPRDAQGPPRALPAQAAVLRLPAAPAQPHAVPAGRFRDQLRARPTRRSSRTSTSSATAKPNDTASAPPTWSSASRATASRPATCPTSPRSSSYLRGQLGAGDLVVTMGAGNVWEIGRDWSD